MSVSKLLHFNNRKLVSSLFVLTFFASVVTVSASSVLPCPARGDRSRYADVDEEREGDSSRGRHGAAATVVERKPRRWIEETRP